MEVSSEADPGTVKGEVAEAGVEEGARGEWGSQLEFILTIVGYAVGLGNVWRFPYLCYANGGGAFLIPYFIMLALIGLPIFYMELCLGQFSSLSPINLWRVNPLFKGLGWAMVLTNTLIVIYYNVVICWSMYYFFASMTTVPMPWDVCTHSYNTPACATNANYTYLRENNITTNFTYNGEEFANISDLHSSSEEYYYLGVLELSSGINDAGKIVWYLALCLLLSWVIVYFVLFRGIATLGKVVYFSSIFPYILLTIMLIRGVTLPGASVGISYYLKPVWSKLMEAQVWSEAATQIFFSLSTCTGGLIAMASYNKFHNNCLRDAILVPLINCFTSFYAGFAIFSVLGFMAVEQGVSVDQVAADGPGLVFVVYPEGLSQMPVAPLWSILFFLMLMTLGFSSSFSMAECFFTSFIDEFPFLKRDKKTQIIFRTIFCTIFFLIGLSMTTQGGYYLFNIFNDYTGSFPLLFIGLFETTIISWWYGFPRFAEDIFMMLGKKPNIFYRATWMVISPGLLLVVIIGTAVQWTSPTLDIFSVYVYPPVGNAIGWLLVAVPLMWIPVIFLFRLCKDGAWKVLKSSSEPTEEWGPANLRDRVGTCYERPQDEAAKAAMTRASGKDPLGEEGFRYINPAFDYGHPAVQNGDLATEVTLTATSFTTL